MKAYRGGTDDNRLNAMMLKLCLLAALCSQAVCYPSRTELLEHVLHSVEKALAFFTEDYSSINVDGLFGLRLGQGQLVESIRECKESKKCDPGLLKRLETTQTRLATACDSALPYVEQSDPDYYNRFLATIDSPYVLPYTPTTFRGVPPQTGSDGNYDEEKGDACYARMLGTYKENNVVLPKCNITDDCWRYMTKENTRDYTITHQLLYFILIQHIGCQQSVENYISGSKIYDVQKALCSKIYQESREEEKNGHVTMGRHDLFLEQTVLCGPLGFLDFLRQDWIRMVLTWPDRRLGCFRHDVLKELEEIIGMDGKHSNDDKKNEIQPEKISMRKLLREKEMKEGCLSHTSGLGFGVLSTYLRYLLK